MVSTVWANTQSADHRPGLWITWSATVQQGCVFVWFRGIEKNPKKQEAPAAQDYNVNQTQFPSCSRVNERKSVNVWRRWRDAEKLRLKATWAKYLYLIFLVLYITAADSEWRCTDAVSRFLDIPVAYINVWTVLSAHWHGSQRPAWNSSEKKKEKEKKGQAESTSSYYKFYLQRKDNGISSRRMWGKWRGKRSAPAPASRS